MPRDKDLKRLVRTRQRRTGESYTTARAQVLAKKKTRAPAATAATAAPAVPAVDYAAIAGMSDDSVRRKTGRTWQQWVRALDAAGAARLPHRDIARWLHEEHDVPGWWAQMITVAYERIRGLREKGQRRGGGFDVNKSKTLPVPVGILYRAFGAAGRRRWLGDVAVRVNKATPSKSMRLRWSDGKPVEVYFTAKGASKSQVQLQHRGFPTRAEADRARAFWTERLSALAEHLT